MGLLDDYEIDMDKIEANSFDVPDNIYEFTLGEIDVYETKDNRESIRFHYDLTDDNDKSFKFTEWFNLPEDSANLTEANKIALGRLKTRILSLGVPEEQAGKVGNEELIGAYGTLQLVSSKGKNGKTYQNVRNLRVSEDWLNDEPEPAPEPVKAKRVPRAKAAAKPAAAPNKRVEDGVTVEESYDVDADLDAKLAALDKPKAAAPTEEPVDDIKARIAAKRAARLAAANTSGTRVNPFPED